MDADPPEHLKRTQDCLCLLGVVDTLFRQTAAFSVQNHTLRKSLALTQLTLTLMVLRATACLLALLLVAGLAAEEDACEAVPTNATALLQTLQLLGSHVENMCNGQALGVFLNVQTLFCDLKALVMECE